MSFWAGIKHALNSTIGTDNFQPLDEIMHKQWTIVASDDVYESFDSKRIDESFSYLYDKTTADTTITLFSVRMTKYGTIRIPYAISLGHGQSNNYTSASSSATFTINRNGISVASETYNSVTNLSGTTGSGSFDVSVSPGDIITAELNLEAKFSTSSNGTWTASVICSDLSICGTLKNSFYTKLE